MYHSLLIFLRGLRRKKLYSFINILGLTVGFVCTLLIYLYVQNETNYDKFHEDGERIYRVNQTFIWGEDNSNIFSSTGPGVAEAIKQEIPEVEHVVKVHTPDQVLPIQFTKDGESYFFNEETVFAVDSNFLSVFTFPLRYGIKGDVLIEPNTAVLTEEAAAKYFGEVNPVGKILEMGEGDNRKTIKVTGVLEKIEGNSYLDFDILISMNSIPRVKRHYWSWMWTTFETFILIRENGNEIELAKKLNELPKKHAARTLKIMGYTYDEYIASGKEWNLYLQKFEDIHLYSNNIYNRLNTVGNHKVINALIGSAILIILLSTINFVNLTTAQFTSKAKNSALRKVLGSSKASLRIHFILESFFFCLISFVIGLGLLYYFLPLFYQEIGSDLQTKYLFNPIILSIGFLLLLIISLLSGVYPAMYFTSFKPSEAIKGELSSGIKGNGIRNSLLVVQYALSFLLLFCTVTVSSQLEYVFSKDLGFNRENILVLNNVQWTNNGDENVPETFSNELGKLGSITHTSICDAPPLVVYNGDQFQPDVPEASSTPLNYVLGDEDYMKALDLELKHGRYFDKSFSDDINGVVLNETAVRSMGWEVNEEVLNQKISNWSGTYKVLGVLKDFNYWSLQAPIEPFAIFHAKSNAQGGRPITRIIARTNHYGTTELESLIDEIEGVWESFVPSRQMEYYLLDQVYESNYQSEKQFSKVLIAFSVLSILIATLGLLGIVIYTVEQKLKEVGIRRVLGASVSHIVRIFSLSYVKLLVLAIVIAAPLGFLFMNSWLQDFADRINVSPIHFIWSGLALFIITLSITAYQSIRASLINPAKVLKDE